MVVARRRRNDQQAQQGRRGNGEEAPERDRVHTRRPRPVPTPQPDGQDHAAGRQHRQRGRLRHGGGDSLVPTRQGRRRRRRDDAVVPDLGHEVAAELVGMEDVLHVGRCRRGVRAVQGGVERRVHVDEADVGPGGPRGSHGGPHVNVEPLPGHVRRHIAAVRYGLGDNQVGKRRDTLDRRDQQFHPVLHVVVRQIRARIEVVGPDHQQDIGVGGIHARVGERVGGAGDRLQQAGPRGRVGHAVDRVLVGDRVAAETFVGNHRGRIAGLAEQALQGGEIKPTRRDRVTQGKKVDGRCADAVAPTVRPNSATAQVETRILTRTELKRAPPLQHRPKSPTRGAEDAVPGAANADFSI